MELVVMASAVRWVAELGAEVFYEKLLDGLGFVDGFLYPEAVVMLGLALSRLYLG